MIFKYNFMLEIEVCMYNVKLFVCYLLKFEFLVFLEMKLYLCIEKCGFKFKY